VVRVSGGAGTRSIWFAWWIRLAEKSRFGASIRFGRSLIIQRKNAVSGRAWPKTASPNTVTRTQFGDGFQIRHNGVEKF
jgi:hypothetical protein